MPTYQEIINQIEALKVQAEETRKQELASAISDVKRLIAQYGLTAADLGFASRATLKTKSRGVVAPKYRDPASGQTWTGRGRRPAWVVALEASGKTLDSCRI